MSLFGSQQKVFLRLLAVLRPHWHTDQSLPLRIQQEFAANRSFGSRDRKLYRELIYTTLRYLPWIEPLLDTDPGRAATIVAWLAADLPATKAYRAGTCGDWPRCPASIASRAAHLHLEPSLLLPGWLPRHCPAAGIAPDLDAIHARAAVWLRLQSPDPAPVLAEFAALGWTTRPSPALAGAIELLSDADITKTNFFLSGLVEVQDLGSQMILASAAIPAGGRWLDACAGAGGKTLQLASILGPTGHIDAYDIRASALKELQIRATRARLTKIAILPAAPTALYDGVLVDAPCSGTGTWRRAPHLKWTTTPAQVTAAAEQQLALLNTYAALVRPGGQLVYATCSLSHFENEDVIRAFLSANPSFQPELPPPARAFGFAPDPATGGLTILPAKHNTDGFFVATLRRQ
jgi:16S rRNA (cytosine967-C5)-methyltransferase